MNRRNFIKTAILVIAGIVLGKGLSGKQVETKAGPSEEGGYVVPSKFADYLRDAYNDSMLRRRAIKFETESCWGTPIEPTINPDGSYTHTFDVRPKRVNIDYLGDPTDEERLRSFIEQCRPNGYVFLGYKQKLTHPQFTTLQFERMI